MGKRFRKLAALGMACALMACAMPLAGAEQAADIGEKPVLRGLVETGVLVDSPSTGPNYEDIVEATGYELQLDIYQDDQRETKINMAIASGEDYDFVRGSTNTMIFNFIDNGALAPLNAAIDQYGQDLKAAFDEAVWREVTYEDGNIYVVPSTGMPRLWNGLTIRQDWLDELGMSAPTTTDELMEVLRAFKEKDPGQVGAERIIPFSTAMFSGKIDDDPLLGAFGITYPWVERDGKLVNRVELPEYREYVEFYRQMYSEGLLDKDLAVNKDSTLMEKVNKGQVGVARYPWNLTYQTRDIWAAENPDWKLSYLNALTGPDGQKGQQVEGGLSARIVVPRTSQKVDHVINFCNEFVRNYEYLMIGEEGVTWERQGDVRVPILPAFNEQRGDTFYYQPVSVGDIEYPMWLMRVYKLESMGQAYSDEMAALSDDVVENPVAFAMNLPVRQSNAATLSQLELETVLKIIVGDLEMDALDDMIAQWKAQGGDASTQEVNEWYARSKQA